MAKQPIEFPSIDSRPDSEDADRLAELYRELSEAVDEVRFDEKVRSGTPRGQLAQLKFLAQKLDEQAKLFRTDDTQATLLLARPNLARLHEAGTEAKVQFGLSNDATTVIATATAGLAAAVVITASGETGADAETIDAGAEAFLRAASSSTLLHRDR